MGLSPLAHDISRWCFHLGVGTIDANEYQLETVFHNVTEVYCFLAGRTE